MNPSPEDIWCNPPPPGTEVEDRRGLDECDRSPKSRLLDEIDPYLKNPHYIEYEKHRSRSSHKHKRTRSRSHERRHSRSRSRNRHRHKKERRRRSTSTSRSHHKRSRSRGRHHRHRSKSRSDSKHRHHKERRRKRSATSSSRSSSRSPNHRSLHSKRSKRSRSRRSRSYNIADYDNKEERKTDIDKNPENDVDDEEEETEPPKENVFKNDGSFLEMFKKIQEEQKAEAAKQEASTSETKKPLPVFGKRRGGRVLKTGMVQKTRTMQENELENSQDAWSIYMKEVKKYKEACCDDDTKTRPLVK